MVKMQEEEVTDQRNLANSNNIYKKEGHPSNVKPTNGSHSSCANASGKSNSVRIEPVSQSVMTLGYKVHTGLQYVRFTALSYQNT